MSSSASSVLTCLSSLNAVVSAEGGRLRVEAPHGALTDQIRQALKHHKPEILAFLERKEHLLGMSLVEFARSRYRAELRIPGCAQTMWWVPTSRDVDALIQQGISRGRIWTAEELQRVWDLGDLNEAQVQTLARIKIELGCELSSITPPLDDPRG